MPGRIGRRDDTAGDGMRHDDAQSGVRFWPILMGRSVIAAVAAVAVTFSPDHSPAFGLVVIGAFALAWGLHGLLTARPANLPVPAAPTVLASSAASMVVGAGALVVLLAGRAIPALLALVVVVVLLGAVSTVGEIVLSRSPMAGAPTAADHRVLAVVSALLVLGALLARDNAVVVVGMFGAWAAVTAVFTLITAFTLKWESDRSHRPAVNS